MKEPKAKTRRPITTRLDMWRAAKERLKRTPSLDAAIELQSATRKLKAATRESLKLIHTD